MIAAAHTYLGAKTINGVPGDYRVPAQPGEEIRLRVVNTDNGPIKAWSDTPYRLLAVDGTDVNQPGEVVDQSVTMTGGARVDLGLTMPADGRPVRVQVSKGTAVILGEGDPAAAAGTASGAGPAGVRSSARSWPSTRTGRTDRSTTRSAIGPGS